MKTLISFTTLLILTHMITTEAQEGSRDPVLDTNGNELQAGTRYDLRPALPDTGGGVYVLVIGPFDRPCVYAVGQTELFHMLGHSLTFSPAKPEKGGAILESTDVNIMFPSIGGCGPTVWRVDEYDPNAGQYFIMTGGVQGNPGNETINNWFKIEKVDSGPNHYKIVFCPTVCDFCVVACSDLGVILYDGFRRVVLSDDPLVVTFLRV